MENNHLRKKVPEARGRGLNGYTNAIYFKGTWVKRFEKNQTRDENFWVSKTSAVKVPMMRQFDGIFNYGETDNLQILMMPYKGHLFMMVLLPKNNDLLSLESALSLEKIKYWRSEVNEQHVDVFMPKFTFNTKYFLKDTLAEMGMPTAFISGHADLSGMDGTQNLFIQDVIHQTFVDVNEEGTEATAGSGTSFFGIGAASHPSHPIFCADHPFIFAILDAENLLYDPRILFLGRVVNPNK